MKDGEPVIRGIEANSLGVNERDYMGDTGGTEPAGGYKHAIHIPEDGKPKIPGPPILILREKASHP